MRPLDSIIPIDPRSKITKDFDGSESPSTVFRPQQHSSINGSPFFPTEGPSPSLLPKDGCMVFLRGILRLAENLVCSGTDSLNGYPLETWKSFPY